MDNNSPDVERRHNLSESLDKFQLKTQLKRGTGTRDQDTFDARVKGDDAGEVAEGMRELIDEMEQHDLIEDIRATQPGDDDE